MDLVESTLTKLAYSENGTKLGVNEFISNYQKNDNLIRYFSKPDLCNSNNKSRENANDSADRHIKYAGSSSKRGKFDEKVEIFLERFKELESYSPSKIVNGEQLRDSVECNVTQGCLICSC